MPTTTTPPPKKVSHLVSFFESAATSTPPIPSSISSRSSERSHARPSARASIPQNASSTPLREFALLTGSSASRSGIRRKKEEEGKISVTSHVRKLSLEVPATAVLAPLTSSQNGELRGRVGEMDWTSRPRDLGQIRAQSRARINQLNHQRVIPTTRGLPLKATPIQDSGIYPPVASTSKSTLPVHSSGSSAVPTLKVARKAASMFKPGRLAPPPPAMDTPIISTNSAGASNETRVEAVAAKSVVTMPSGSSSGPSSTHDAPDGKVSSVDPICSSPFIGAHDIPSSSASVTTVSEKLASLIRDSPSNPYEDHTSIRLPLATPPPPAYVDTFPPRRPFARPIQPTKGSSPKSVSFAEPSTSQGPSAYRSRLHHSSASVQTTRNLPAATLFQSKAKPLVLPHLEDYLDKLVPGKFSDPNDPGVLSKSEREGWNEWLTTEKVGFWRKIFGSKLRNGRYHNLDVEKESVPMVGASDRRLIFPPMHLVPPELTVSDLKSNRLNIPFLTLDTILGTAIDGVLAGEGSSYGISYETIESFRDLMQMITLLVGSKSTTSSTTTPWLHTVISIPRVISLDFVSAFGMAVIWLWVFTFIALLSVYELYRFTGGWRGHSQEVRDEGEGFDREGAFDAGGGGQRKGWRNSRGYKMFVSFVATSLYLPLSKISIGALAWTSDYWAIADPYVSTDFPTPAPLGAASEYYDTLDFCYRTTMLRPQGFKHFNWAYLILPVAITTIFWLTIWLPWRVHQVIQASAPRVDPYTELGEKRRDISAEYTRLLAEDKSPFSFLYQAYRRPWASFKSIYMIVKLINILIVVLLTKDNCIFRNHTFSSLAIIRQGSLLLFMSLFLLADLFSKPFVDYISNNSDLVSRLGFVVLAFLGLLVALDVPGKAQLAGPVVIFVDIVVYGFNAYFTIISTAFAMSWVKRLQFRLDFSIDLFSPHLDLAKHVQRRIWQETWSALLLAAPEFKMAPGDVKFSEDPTLPPYLLGFRGTQAERYVENLKILRSIGLEAYSDAIAARLLPESCQVMRIRRCVQENYTGPDIVWLPPHSPAPAHVTSFFGRLDVFNFPFLAVFRYDQDPARIIHISDITELELLIRQNESPETRESRSVRLALRALDGQLINVPHTETTDLGRRRGTSVQGRTFYRVATLRIGRNSSLKWRDYNYSSGFNVTLTWNDGQSQDSDITSQSVKSLTKSGAELGIRSDFRLSPGLAKILRRNRELVEGRVPEVELILERHRAWFTNESNWKHHTLSHAFLFDVVSNSNLSMEELDNILHSTESDGKVRELVTNYHGSMLYLQERMKAVMTSRIHQWWYLLWDDIWRRNRNEVSFSNDFSPHYRSSICYTPMSRASLERFLGGHSLWKNAGARGFFNAGFLNRIYFYLDEIVFEGTSLAVNIHLGRAQKSLDFDDLEHAVPGRVQVAYDSHFSRANPDRSFAFSSNHSYDTGGTDHDSSVIRFRHAFTFEELYDLPKLRWSDGRLNWMKDLLFARAGERALIWLGLRPFRHDHRANAEGGVTLDLRKTQLGWELPRVRSEEKKPDASEGGNKSGETTDAKSGL